MAAVHHMVFVHHHHHHLVAGVDNKVAAGQGIVVRLHLEFAGKCSGRDSVGHSPDTDCCSY